MIEKLISSYNELKNSIDYTELGSIAIKVEDFEKLINKLQEMVDDRKKILNIIDEAHQDWLNIECDRYTLGESSSKKIADILKGEDNEL